MECEAKERKTEERDECCYLYDVSMSYVNPGWQERYCQLVEQIEAHLRANYEAFFAELQLYQTGPMNYVVVAVYRDVPGVREELSKILHYVNEEYRVTVGQNVRRKQILKFDRAKMLYGRQTNGTIDTM
ncbi:MAG: hypothetical protein SOZ48_06360 [Eubacterium sp.]|nr:hypothetical protein [Eubacterium sp.]